MDYTFRISSSTTVKGIPRILTRCSLFRDDERRTELLLRLRRRSLLCDPIILRKKVFEEMLYECIIKLRELNSYVLSLTLICIFWWG